MSPSRKRALCKNYTPLSLSRPSLPSSSTPLPFQVDRFSLARDSVGTARISLPCHLPRAANLDELVLDRGSRGELDCHAPKRVALPVRRPIEREGLSRVPLAESSDVSDTIEWVFYQPLNPQRRNIGGKTEAGSRYHSHLDRIPQNGISHWHQLLEGDVGRSQRTDST